MALLNTLRFLVTHPLGSRRPLVSIANFVRFQLASRLAPDALVVPFVDDTRLLVRRGMAGTQEVEIASGLAAGQEIIVSDMSAYEHMAEIRIH